MFSGVFALSALMSSGLVAQEIAITGKDFESGAADAKLAEIARQAAASGKSVVVTAPPYWQGKAAAKLHAGAGNVQVKSSDAFFENVLVRIVDKPADKSDKLADKPKPAEAPKPAVAAAKPAVAPAAKSELKPAAPKPAAVPPTVASTPKAQAPKVEHSATPTAPVAPQPAPATVASVSTPQPVSAPAAAPATAPTAPKNAQVNVAEARKRFEARLNLGKAAEGNLKPGQLQKGDEIFVSGPVRAVVRRFGSRVQLFWLEGDLNLDRSELSMAEAGHYKVNESVSEQVNSSVRAMHATPVMFAAEMPAAKSKVRADMEKHFNDAKPIDDTLRPEELRYGDLFYTFRNYGVVFRRTDLGFNRYWLVGKLDLNQAGIIKDGDAYRLVSERL